MFNDKVDDMEDRIEEQICSGAVLRLGSYFNSLTELFQSASFLKGKFAYLYSTILQKI